MTEFVVGQFREDVEALALSGREGRTPALSDADHAHRFRSSLARVLVNRQALREYVRFLNRYFPTRFPFLDALPETLLDALLRDGLDTPQLSDAELARLALNPVALQMLANEIQKAFPPSWWEAFEEEGKRRLAEAGREELPEALRAALEQPGLVQPAGVLKTGPGPFGSEVQRGEPWQFAIPVSACTWEQGTPPEGLAEITLTAQWLSTGVLEVAVIEGLVIRPGQRLEVRWLSTQGELKAETESVGYDPPCLKSPDGGCPIPGDRLELKHTGAAGKQPQPAWTVRWGVTFD